MPKIEAAQRDLGGVLRAGNALGFQRKRDVAVDGQVRIERVALEDHRDPPLPRREPVDEDAADPDLAGRGLLEPGDHPENCRLAGAGGTEQHEELAVAALEVDAVHRRPGGPGEALGQASRLDDGHRA